ncbi:MAG: adenine phosphoribosyltransferase [Trizodia sp. TS-e1964]|nr:MAG: adenine phosphoribosyltransferase [Trizodia sp. TS-e1964]
MSDIDPISKSAIDSHIHSLPAEHTSLSATSSAISSTLAPSSNGSSDPSKNPRYSSTTPARPSELTHLTISLHAALRHFPDFPQPGIDFIDIFPLFSDPALHESLLHALEIAIIAFPSPRISASASGTSKKPDVIVGLDARGFLFGPSLALRLGASFVPVRKMGKLPGPTVSASFDKEYGSGDSFQMQTDAVKPGQTVIVVDDIIATGWSSHHLFSFSLPTYSFGLYLGGSAEAAGSLVKQLGGTVMGYLFVLEIGFLNGKSRLDAPVFTLLEGT